MGSDLLRARDFDTIKVPGSENVADLFTKYLPRVDHETHTLALGLRDEEGRAASAAKIGDQLMVCCLSQFYDANLHAWDDADVRAPPRGEQEHGECVVHGRLERGKLRSNIIIVIIIKNPIVSTECADSEPHTRA